MIGTDYPAFFIHLHKAHDEKQIGTLIKRIKLIYTDIL